MRDAWADYLAGDADLRRFYAAPLESLWSTPDTPAQWRPELVVAIQQYNATLGVPKELAGDEYAIVTGQQPGIFTGPLFTIYKAITALKIARLHQERTGAPTRPVFWVGSEDHDFDEARVVHYLSRNHEPIPIEYDASVGVDSMPMYRVPLNGVLHESIDRMVAETLGADPRDEIQALLHDTLDQADSLADWTARLLAALFRNTELVLFAPHLRAARQVAATIIEREIAEPLETTRIVNEAGKALANAGYEPQVVKAEDECSFFVEVDGHRRKVTYDGDRFLLPETKTAFTENQLLNLLQTSPERFSPNVALRCVVQQHLFPVRAYIAGPSELAYWGQLRGVFNRHKLAMPVVYPRARCTITSTKLNQLRAEFGVESEDLTQHEDALVERAERHASQSPALARVKQAEETLHDALTQLSADLETDSATAARMTERLDEAIQQKLSRIERTLLHEDKIFHESTRAQIRRLCNALAPLRKPQERVYTIFSFLGAEGVGLIDRLIEAIDVESFAMNEVEL